MLKKLQKREEGFTLAELLIVVAIIAVLVAIAIPVFTTRLEQSRETTDIANLRSAYAAAQVAALSGGEDGNKLEDGDYAYNPDSNIGLTKDGTYKIGKGTATDGKADYSALPAVVKSNYANNVDHRDNTIVCTFADGSVTSIKFEAK